MPPNGTERLTGVIACDNGGRWRWGQGRDDLWRVGVGECAVVERAGEAWHLDHERSVLIAGATNSVHLATVSDRHAAEGEASGSSLDPRLTRQPLTDRNERCRIGENQGALTLPGSISASRLCWCGWALLAWCRHRAGESRRDAPRCLWQSSERRCDTERSGYEQAETQHHDVAGRLCRRP